MDNFELIDDYLTNRLSEQDKVNFEKQLTSDANLKSDVELQRGILEGVKTARAIELKAMLNAVPIGASVSTGVAAGKIAAGIIATGIIGTSLYYYFKPEEPKTVQPTSPISENRPAVKDSVIKLEVVEETTTPETKQTPPKKEASTPTKEQPKDEVAQAKKIEVVDPSDELVDNSKNETTKNNNSANEISSSKIVVDTQTGNKKYNFNYQFAEGKLILFGPFDKNLYEILEIHGEKNTIFLFYKDSYYLLDEKQSTVTTLVPIKDASLLRKLKEYRSGN
jgi:hypothetical protein